MPVKYHVFCRCIWLKQVFSKFLIKKSNLIIRFHGMLFIIRFMGCSFKKIQQGPFSQCKMSIAIRKSQSKISHETENMTNANGLGPRNASLWLWVSSALPDTPWEGRDLADCEEGWKRKPAEEDIAQQITGGERVSLTIIFYRVPRGHIKSRATF